MKKIKKIVFLLLGIIFFVISLIEIFVTKTYSTNFEVLDIKSSQFNKLKENIEYFVSDYDGVVAVYIKDLDNGGEVLLNENMRIPAASVIKIPIMAAVYYLVQIGELSLDEELIYEKRHRCGGSGKIKYLPYKTRFKLEELVELMITDSDNVATNMITERVGIKRLNNIFKEQFGMQNTDMNRYIMDLKLRNRGIENYTTAKEIGSMLENIYRGDMVSKDFSLKMLSILMKQKIADRIPKYLPKETVVAHKTGLMRDSCHDAGIVFTNKGNFVIVVLTQKIDIQTAKNVIAEIAYKTYSIYQ